MGKTAVVLPDPLDKTVKAGGGSADDLLAQLAGEEIDRLLSEAETHGATPEEAARPESPPPPPPAAEDQPTTDESPEIPVETPAEMEVAQAIVEPPAAAQEPTPPAPVNAPAAAVAAAPAAPPPAATEKPAAAAPAAPTVSVDMNALAAKIVAQTDMATSLVERSMLDLSSDPAPAKVEHHLPAWLNPLVWLIKILEWINAPLKACPQNVRDNIGKVGLVMMFNALAILAYICFFRRPHQ